MKKEDAVLLRGLRPSFSSDRIFRRLGYRKSLVQITKIEKQKLLKLMKNLWLECDFLAIYRRANLLFEEKDSVSINSDFVVSSNNLMKFLGKATSLFVVVVSGGSRICSLRDDFVAAGDNSKAIIADAVGSEFVTSSLRLLKSVIEKKICSQGQLLRGGWISPGVGDISLEVQQDLFTFLNPERAAISLNEQLIMEPEKSATAFFAIL